MTLPTPDTAVVRYIVCAVCGEYPRQVHNDNGAREEWVTEAIRLVRCDHCHLVVCCSCLAGWCCERRELLCKPCAVTTTQNDKGQPNGAVDFQF